MTKNDIEFIGAVIGLCHEQVSAKFADVPNGPRLADIAAGIYVTTFADALAGSRAFNQEKFLNACSGRIS